MVKKQRPVNLELQTIRFPITAIASILHRVSGVIMFFAVAILLWMLAESLSSEAGFDAVKAMMSGFFAKFIVWGILTALAYHLVGGIRHLIMDMGYWEELPSGNASAQAAIVITLILSVLAGVWLW
ncbi:succinate dehydrogenase cytochrome b556 subunit [Gallaecimonas kandeliae]|uniref:succinate dehydrogenase cytochrome b556 subunit n=1 Tax=Gallaecimonas kandeliae TaxID=3029055 RepID=UPI002648E296|nr:succinate dehydrogenase cytochrome b556 subunit [Gallaecimonas kandeliae]WKE67460.1 succinate dehydrogenase cytochrome b556 subunit [Gallaecimonas kandeliae]